MGSYGGYLLETFATLVVVCALAFVVLYGARRLGVGRPRGPIQLIGQLPLDARRAIYLVQVGEQVLVVGASEAGFTKLGEVSSRELPLSEAVRGASFEAVLSHVTGKRSRDAAPIAMSEQRVEAVEGVRFASAMSPAAPVERRESVDTLQKIAQ